MSKVDAQRAIREANYARNRASGPTRREVAAAAAAAAEVEADGTSTVPAAHAPRVKPARAAVDAPASVASQTEPCGHKSMNGRTCTRDAGHSEKSHRYS